MTWQKLSIAIVGAAAVILETGIASFAATFGGVEFPNGAVSFADRVISYNPNITNGSPVAIARDPSKILGSPDCGLISLFCDVSLGRGGSITVQFTNNFLTGSGNNAPDLWIFETGLDSEDTFVDLSKDGFKWHSVGKILGGTRGIDIDLFGWGKNDLFSFVRITDDPNQGNETKLWGKLDLYLGADIDAVGAISYATPTPTPTPTPIKSVPEPNSTLGLLFLIGVASASSRRAKIGGFKKLS